jgi:hypothetical protein
MRSVLALASPALTSSTIMPTMKPRASMTASVQPSRLPARSSSARRRVAGALLRLRALRCGLPTEDIVSAYGMASHSSSSQRGLLSYSFFFPSSQFWNGP